MFREHRERLFPREDFVVVQALLEEATGRSAQEGSTIGKPQRWILTLLGIGHLAIGPILWFLLSDGGELIAVYAGAIFGTIGIVMLWYAKTAYGSYWSAVGSG